MISLTAVLASLPPASLAETDLPRFVAQTLGRRTRQELPGLSSLFSEESLRGYPAALGAVLASACDALVADHLDPQLLDSRSCDALLGSRSFLSALEGRVEVRRQRLRPGTLVTGELRTTLGMRLTVLPGVGRELMLVSPVDLAQVPDARFAMPLTVVIAKPGSAAEGDLYRTAWAPIEEAFGLTGPQAERWTARFFAITRRENHDARLVRDGLTPLLTETRRRLFETLIAHLRDGELPEQHRPGRRGLETRLSALGLELDRPWMEPLLHLVESTYRAVGLDPDVSAGRCPCPREDLVRWAGWVDVPAAQKKLLMDLDPAVIEHLLVALTELEMGRADGLVDDALRRPLASLRDGCLRPRWQRSQAALTGIDPLVLAEARIGSGDDRETIAERLQLLAEEARQAMTASPSEDRHEPEKKPRPGRKSALRAEVPSPAPSEPVLEAASPTAPARAESPVNPDTGSSSRPTPQIPRTDPKSEPRPEPRPDVPAVAPPRFQLPPMPDIPPPRPAPRVRPRTDFPAPPSGPPASFPRLPDRPPTGRPQVTPSDRPHRPDRPPTARPAEQALEGPATERPPTLAPRPSLQRLPTDGPELPQPAERASPRPVRPPSIVSPGSSSSPTAAGPAAPFTARPPAPRGPRPQTTPHLVTPTQGNEFYDAAFRELELIERDLLQRGPTGQARERTEAIGREARELHDALGPSARSGDREFLAAQRRLDKVIDYLARLQPLLEGPPPASSPTLGQRLKGLFSRR